MNDKIQQILAEIHDRFQNLYRDRLYRMILFGSHAREDADPDSDIDLLVVLEEPVDAGMEIERTGSIVTDICLEYGVVVGCVFVDKERFLTRQGPFLRNIRREGVTV
jgi:predicted nucleotidyltransferase